MADWDGDGHLDLIVIFAGMRWAVNMSFYQNQGGNGFLMRCMRWDEQNDCCAAWLLTRPGGKLVLSHDLALSQIDGLAPRLQPVAVDWDDDGFTDLILAPEGRFFRRKPGVEKDLMAKEGWPGVGVYGGSCAHQLIGPIALLCFTRTFSIAPL